MRRSNDLARRLIVLMRWDRRVRINHGQEKRGADYERKYVLISLGERHLRQGEGPDEADLPQLCSQCFPPPAQCWRLHRHRMCKNDRCNASDGAGRWRNCRRSLGTKAIIVQAAGAKQVGGTSAAMAHSGRPSRRPVEHSKLAALFALVVLSVTPASADDLIERWLKKDEASAQTVEARPDLNALTDEQWHEIFKFGREVEYTRETPTRTLPLWLAALVVACGIVIGGVKVRSFMRRQL